MKKKILAAIICVILIFAIAAGAYVFLFGGTFSYRVKELNETVSENAGSAYHKYVSDNSLFVGKSGLIELYFDKETYAVAVKDTSADRLWSSLPVSDGVQEQAAVLSVKLSDKKGNIYYLNSQDNSVAFGSASFEPVENGISVTYRMALTEEKASYSISQLDSDTPAVEITLNYTLADGSLYVGVLNSDIISPKGIAVEGVTLLDSFCSDAEATEEDYLFVPDGCGALIMSGAESDSDVPAADYSFKVYNRSLSVDNDTIIPAFGMKQGAAAFLAIIESGDTLATVKASRDLSSALKVSAEFEINGKVYTQSTSFRKGYEVTETGRNTDSISVCYRFLSGKNATYVGFSTACREQLIRNGVLSTGTVEESEYFPFFITLDGALAKKNGGKKYYTLTTFEEAEDIVAQLKAKGVNNAFVNMRYSLSGADVQFDVKNAKLLSQLGGNDSFSALYDYISTQQMKLFLDVRALSSVRGKNGFGNGESRNGYEKVTRQIKQEINKKDYSVFALLEGNKIEDKSAQLLRNFKDIPVSGYCVSDYGITEYGFDPSNSSLEPTVEAIVNASSALATERTLVLSHGNFNTVKYANIIDRLPSETSIEPDRYYVAVPFVELVLHGTCEYTFEPINLHLNSRQAMLKCAEYGAIPSYEWYYESVGTEDTDAVYRYDNSINEAADFYAKLSTLNDIRTSRMTGHSEVADGVYLTEYSNGSRIYVNYNDADVEVGDILIGKTDFVKIG